MPGHVVIAGAGQAAATVVERLLSAGFKGGITVIGDEPVAPYQRPPLSKEYLKGSLDVDRLILRPPSYYENAGVHMVLGTRVAAIDTAAKCVTTSGGERLSYGTLVLATGARPRRLPLSGIDAENVFVVRTLDDINRMKHVLADVRKAAIIGGGFIGLEAAAVLRLREIDVSVLEATSRLMGRVVSDPVSTSFGLLHRSRGVDIRTNTVVRELVLRQGRVARVRLSDDMTVESDIVVLGVGAMANTEVAEAAGIACGTGILVDTACKTSAPDVYAIGDCTLLSHARYPGQFRLESVQNAIDQARVAADRILGGDASYSAVPWFWSDQFDAKLQIAGMVPGDGTFMHFGSIEAANLLVAHFDREDGFVAAETINRASDHMASRRLLAMNEPIRKSAILAAGGDLKTVMKDALIR